MNDFDKILVFVLVFMGIFFVLDAIFYGFCFKKVFEKAKYKPGDAFIPILNLYRITQIAGFPGWTVFGFLLFSFPGVMLWRIFVALGLAKAFNTGPVIVLALVMSLPIGCILIGYSNFDYPLSEEELAKKNAEGFSTENEAKK